MRLTRFVCLWNISTKPQSLWLAYDYDISNSFEHDGLEYDDMDDNDSGKMECYHQYHNSAILPEHESVQGLRDLRTKAIFKLLRGAKRAGGARMIDIGMIIEDVREWDQSVGIPFEKALESLQRTRQSIGSELHAIDVPLA